MNFWLYDKVSKPDADTHVEKRVRIIFSLISSLRILFNFDSFGYDELNFITQLCASTIRTQIEGMFDFPADPDISIARFAHAYSM